jgi:hypothetical protein
MTQVLRAAVPETSIHKNGEPFFAENKIRAPEQWQMSSPAFDSMLSENFNQAHFSSLIPPRPNRSHDLRPFFFAD